MDIEHIKGSGGAESAVGRLAGGSVSKKCGFTLIEMLVVVGIIAILMAAVVAVGTQVRAAAARRATLAELHALEGAMKEYLKSNPEPAAYTAANWPYSLIAANDSNTRSQWDCLNVPSDLTNWVAALRSDPAIAKSLAQFQSDTDAGGQPTAGHVVGGTPIAPQAVILDAYGYPVRYVPSTPQKEGYFISAGPDGKFSMAINTSTGAAITPVLSADELYSTDPQ